MDPRIYFQLAEVFPFGRVTGRNCGADLPLGIIFTGLYRQEFRAFQPGEEITSLEPELVCRVSLRLDAIEMYHRRMDDVPAGHTAALSLSGNGLAAVTRLVSGPPERTRYVLGMAED